MRRPAQRPVRARLSIAERRALAARARYVGSPEHKLGGWWGGLPKARQLQGGKVGRPGKQTTTVCPLTTNEDRAEATEWLRRAIVAGQYRFVEADQDFRSGRGSRRGAGSGAGSASIPPPVSTRAGRSTRTNAVRFSTEWIDDGPNASAEERATLCRLSLYVSDENACSFFEPTSNRTCDHVTVPAVHLAEGLATDWWSIFGGRDRDHAIRKYRTGFALPDVTELGDRLPRGESVS